jgi:hypothetical protein
MGRIGALGLALVLSLALVGCGAKSSKTSAGRTETQNATPGSRVHPGGSIGSSRPETGAHSPGANPSGSGGGSRARIPTSTLPTVICTGPNNGIAHWQPTKRDVDRARKADRKRGLTREMPSVVTGHLLPNGKMAGTCTYGAGYGPNDY